jgi:hypothetical protein
LLALLYHRLQEASSHHTPAARLCLARGSTDAENGFRGVEMSDSAKFNAKEVALYVDAFVRSSNLVRYAIITITIASILLFVGHHNSESDSWFNSRIKTAHVALHENVWLRRAGELQGENELARRWAEARGIHSSDEALQQIKTLEEARTNHLLLQQIPFFGVSHDVNDLGFFGSIALSILMLMLTFSMSRQHENLYLALWRVRRIFDDENREESTQSSANLTYHTLAMSQQFSQPPTLARWRIGKLRSLSKLLLPFALVVQGFCLARDWSTRDLGRIVNPHATNLSLTIQVAALILVFLLTIVCYLYMRSNDLRWEATFFSINPSFRKEVQPSWLEWVQVLRPIRKYCAHNHPRLTTPLGLKHSPPR